MQVQLLAVSQSLKSKNLYVLQNEFCMNHLVIKCFLNQYYNPLHLRIMYK